MTGIQNPVICPKCNSKHVLEVSDGVTQKVWFKWSDEMALYCKHSEDGEVFGSSHLECASCGHIYDLKVYGTWLERQ